MPAIPVTNAVIRQEIGRSLGLVKYVSGTAAVFAPTATTIHSDILVHSATPALLNNYLRLFSGGGADQTRIVIAYAPYSGASASRFARLDVLQSFSPVPSTNTAFELWERISPDRVDEHINQAIRRMAMFQLDGFRDYSIEMDNRLRNPTFDEWAAGVTSAPTGYTLSGTGASVAREATIKYSGRYSAALKNQANQESVLESDDVEGFPAFAGKEISVEAWIYATTADRVRIRLLDGVNTTNSNFHDGNAGWEGDAGAPLTIGVTSTVTLADNLTRLRVQVRLESAAGVITVYAGRVRLRVGDAIFDYRLKDGIAFINKINFEGDRVGVYDQVVPQRAISVDQSVSPRRLVFNRKWFTPVAGRQLEIVGQGHPVEPVNDSDNLTVDPEYVRRRAGMYVIEELPWPPSDTDSMGILRKYQAWQAESERMERQVRRSVKPDSIAVESF